MRVKWACYFFLCLSLSALAAESVEALALTADEQAVVDQTNAQRAKAGKAALKPNALLFDVARKHAEAMAKANELNHRLHGKNSADRVDASGYKWMTVSENIAWNQRSVAEVMEGWMHSDGHRTNLLGGDITEIGVGIANDSQGQPYWVQVFAKPEMPKAPMARLAPGDTTARFVIHNTLADAIAVDVHTGRAFPVKPGEKLSFSLTAPHPEPSITVKSGAGTLEFKVQDGKRYTIGKKGESLELIQAEAEAP